MHNVWNALTNRIYFAQITHSNCSIIYNVESKIVVFCNCCLLLWSLFYRPSCLYRRTIRSLRGPCRCGLSRCVWSAPCSASTWASDLQLHYSSHCPIETLPKRLHDLRTLRAGRKNLKEWGPVRWLQVNATIPYIQPLYLPLYIYTVCTTFFLQGIRIPQENLSPSV